MLSLKTTPLALLILFLTASHSNAGLFNHKSDCCDDGCVASCCNSTCCPEDYCCVAECKSEPVERHCFETECKPVVIPPVRLPCGCCKLKRLFCGKGGCDDGCTTGCDSCCQNGGCGNGLMKKLCSKLTACRVRCVNTYSKKEYECGTKCVTKWKAVRKGCCTAE